MSGALVAGVDFCCAFAAADIAIATVQVALTNRRKSMLA
jgi:hypothetical protein